MLPLVCSCLSWRALKALQSLPSIEEATRLSRNSVFLLSLDYPQIPPALSKALVAFPSPFLFSLIAIRMPLKSLHRLLQ